MLESASSALMRDRERLGNRLLAFAGLWLLLTGIAMSLSLVVVALVAFAVLLVVMLAIGGVALLRRFRVKEGLWTLLASAARAIRKLGRRLDLRIRQQLERLGSRARETAARVPGRANAFQASVLRNYANAVYRVRMLMSQLLRASGRRRALKLNGLGAELRRRGDYEEAAQKHRVALAIVRDLGDERAEALTLNNLALALAQGGAQAEAVEHLEQALVILHKLGDEEHEWRVLANLGIVHRRQGHSEQAVNLLHEALDRLPPESSAYRQVEQELRRAS
jgi:tetratricopeptide (TPR) repeat protein